MSAGLSLTRKRIWVAGHRGMVGSALVRRLARGDCEVITVDRAECDLTEQAPVRRWVAAARPDMVLVAAAKVGGILANMQAPVDFLRDNLLIETNVIEAAHANGVEKLVLLGSSCIYPRDAEQPIREEALLTGPLEVTNQWYAIAKIAGIRLCQAYREQYGDNFIAAMPTNLYGPGDNFDLTTSHVIPALIRKAHAAKLAGENDLEIWGSGRPRREFLHVDDLADAVVFLLQHYDGAEHVNVGSGTDLAIADLAQMVMDVVGLTGALRHDLSKPDGTPRKLMSAGHIAALGWAPRIDLRDGLAQTYRWYRENC